MTQNESEQLFDPDSFGKEEFESWMKCDDRKIKFYGHQSQLKRLRSRLNSYASSDVITIVTVNMKTIQVSKV